MNHRQSCHPIRGRAALNAGIAVAILYASGCLFETDPVIVGDLVPPTAPVVLAEDQNTPFDLVVDGTDVYWMDWLVPPPAGWMGTETRLTTLMKVDTAGANFPEIFDFGEHQGSSANPSVIALDSTDIYWTDTWGHFHKTDRATGTATDVVADRRIQAVAIDATHLYWTDRDADELIFFEKSTGTMTQLASGLDNIGTSLAVDDNNVYWIDKGEFGEDAIMAVDKNGGTPVEVVSSLPILQFSLDASDIYFTSANSAIYSVPKAGGTPTVVAADVSPMGELAIDATHVYWGDIDSGQDGVAVFRMTKADGSITAVADELEGVTDLALDSTHVYWTDRNGGTVMKIAK